MSASHHYTSMTGILIAVSLFLAACAGPWKAAPDHLQAPQWSIASPQGWMHLSTRESEMLSKDGAYLEYILIQAKPLAQGFRYTHRKMDAGMLPHEAARLIVSDLRSDPFIRKFQLIASEPAVVDGHTAFRLTYSYRDQNDVELKTIYYGVILPDQFFNLRYTAARRFYFDQELPAFNKAFQSLRLLSQK